MEPCGWLLFESGDWLDVLELKVGFGFTFLYLAPLFNPHILTSYFATLILSPILPPLFTP